MRLEKDACILCVLKIHSRGIKIVLDEDIAQWLFPELSHSARCSSFLSASANGQTATTVTATRKRRAGMALDNLWIVSLSWKVVLARNF